MKAVLKLIGGKEKDRGNNRRKRKYGRFGEWDQRKKRKRGNMWDRVWWVKKSSSEKDRKGKISRFMYG